MGFYLPSVLRARRADGRRLDGRRPAVSWAIREELEAYFTDDYRVLTRLASKVRAELRRSGDAAGPDAWRRALDPALRRLITEGREDEARDRLLGRLRAGACV